MKIFFQYLFVIIGVCVYGIEGYSQSVLKSGTWVRVKIEESGVYKITYQELVAMGFTNPSSIRVFGNGAAELPLFNSHDLPDVLHEIPIVLNKGTDNLFNAGDFILFYAQSANVWNYNEYTKNFQYKNHSYTNTNYYYITSASSQPLTLESRVDEGSTYSKVINTFDDLYVYEQDMVNPLKSGRSWYESISDKRFSFSVPHIVLSDTAYVSLQVAGRHPTSNFFTVSLNGKSQANISFNGTKTNNPYAYLKKQLFAVLPSASTFSVQVKANFSGVESRAYLDYCQLQVRSYLKASSSQLHFRDAKSIEEGKFARFEIETPTHATVWDITNPQKPIVVQTSYAANKTSFVADISELREYVAFSSDFKTVVFDKVIQNQDILSNIHVDMIIVAGEQFHSYAKQIQQYHERFDGMSITIVTQQQIFNEFSAGRPDISAIRNYFRYVYQKGGTLQYVLFFGDGSFDNRNFDNEQVKIMTFQSKESLHSYASFVSDDFFGILQPETGVTDSDVFYGELDIAIGRFPVNTEKEAADVTKKTLEYMTNSSYRGDWQNYLCFLADDADDGQTFHMSDADLLTKNIAKDYPNFNYDKIYLDAFKQFVTSSGERYPDAQKAINERMKKGCLVFNYTGHGSEIQMAGENVINATTVESWKNGTKLPLFITASCEIARFDNPSIISLGEKFLLQNNGGAIALFTTTRVVFAFSNYSLNNNIYKYLFAQNANGEQLTIGEAFVKAKYDTPNDYNQNKRSFTILGNPALKLAVPQNSIKVETVNGVPLQDFSDTLKARSVNTVAGIVTDLSGNKLSSFSGIMYVTLFDKNQKIVSLANDDGTPFTFYSQKNVLFQGKVSVVNGEYSFDFIIPQDILYYDGLGKLSMFSTNDTIQAAGHVFLPINGSVAGGSVDTQGPTIRMFMNDTLFTSGDMTHERPTLLVYVYDKSGINISDAAIGHSITLVLNDDYSNTILLNDFYRTELNSYTHGTIVYPFSELPPGHHTLTIKIWDTHNNVSEQTISFFVQSASKITVLNVYNYPNPVTEYTTFRFEHNQASEESLLTIRIYDMYGNLVAVLQQEIEPTGFIEKNVRWDCTNIYGSKVSRGVYSYTVEISNQNGIKSYGNHKIIVL